MLSILVGALITALGLAWSSLAVLAPMMASRPVDVWREQVRPLLLGLAVVALGISLIVWR